MPRKETTTPLLPDCGDSEPEQITLQGQIDSITFRNEENGFTVARVTVAGQDGPVTVLGTIAGAAPGELLSMEGTWVRHRKYGLQFKLSRCERTVPVSLAGIRKYLGSGLIAGIGQVLADRIVDQFGKDALRVIEQDTGRLTNVEGIGKKRAARIARSWKEQQEVRDVMLFLQDHDVGVGAAMRIFRQYGSRSIDMVSQNPYRLATEVSGIGFKTADAIAAKIGIPTDSSQRVEAGILYVLQECCDQGHVCYPYDALVARSCELLGVEREAVLQAFAAIALQKRVVVDGSGRESAQVQENDRMVYLTGYHVCETGIAAALKQLLRGSSPMARTDGRALIAQVQVQLAITLAPRQVEAVEMALQRKVMVITGGPGTGKSTIINAIRKIFAGHGRDVLLAAPTGRAAKRMSEITGCEARTIHRLLRYNPGTNAFEHTADNPLVCDMVIVDEASMIDTMLMYHLVSAIPQRAALILVGDVNQLPSVGAGTVLRDIIDSGAVPVVALTEIFRQARESRIIVNAHLINSGQVPESGIGGGESDFYFIERDDPEAVLEQILELASARIPRRFGFSWRDDIQVLTPMHKGMVGTIQLNAELQNLLNPREDGLTRGGRVYKIDDKMMQVRNNYDKEVFNGDIGTIIRIDPENQQVTIVFDGRPVAYDFADLDEVVHAYAVSVHKSQGSEFPVVIMPVVTQHYMLLQRNLLYTGVTRGKQLVVLVGSRKALAIAVKNDNPKQRYTGLCHRLQA